MTLWENIIEVVLIFIATSFYVVGRELKRPWLKVVAGLIGILVVVLWFRLH